MSANLNLKEMSDQELRQYFADTRDERAYQEILSRGPNDADREALEQFLQWEQGQKG
ncbi:MAG: hypothetical protein ACFB8W_04690 [Elainellaceae cyanobacterium]